MNGAIYGVHAGYNFQRGNLVYGLEAGFNGTNMEGSDSCVILFTCERKLDWYATGVGRLGYTTGNTLFYGFGGVAWGKVKTDVSFLATAVLAATPITLAGPQVPASSTRSMTASVHALNIRMSISDRMISPLPIS